MTTYWLPKHLEEKHLLVEAAYILTIQKTDVLKAWMRSTLRWANAGMCPPSVSGPYLILYQPEDPCPLIGFSIFNKGWTPRIDFREVLAATTPPRRELPHHPYDLSQLYWKGLPSQLS